MAMAAGVRGETFSLHCTVTAARAASRRPGRTYVSQFLCMHINLKGVRSRNPAFEAGLREGPPQFSGRSLSQAAACCSLYHNNLAEGSDPRVAAGPQPIDDRRARPNISGPLPPLFPPKWPLPAELGKRATVS